MRISRPAPIARRHSAKSAFTMIEIAMSLAIIGFALVAIIGILPMGIDVQKNNRRETIINQDANYFIEAIRNGARGLDDLTNYVAGIIVTNNGVPLYYINPNPIFTDFPLPAGFTPEPLRLNTGEKIIGLLSTPKYADGVTKQVVAYVQALSGAANEKAPQNSDIIRGLSFSYRLVTEIVAYNTNYYDVSWTNSANHDIYKNLAINLYDVRLLFRWPLLPGHNSGLPKVGNGRQVYRLMVGGCMTNDAANRLLWFFQPQTFTK